MLKWPFFYDAEARRTFLVFAFGSTRLSHLMVFFFVGLVGFVSHFNFTGPGHLSVWEILFITELYYCGKGLSYLMLLRIL